VYYLKHTGKSDFETILEYRIATHQAVIKVETVPEIGINWFGYYKDAIFFGDRHRIYSSLDGHDKHVVVDKANRDVVEAIVYP
jgi:hypothetical protein